MIPTAPGLANDWLRPNSSVSRMIEMRAKRLSRSKWFSPSDADDIAQELRLAVWRQQHRYDEDRTTFATFAERVISSRAISLVRNRLSQKRGAGRSPLSLTHQPLDEKSNQSSVDLKTDLDAALADTCEGLRQLAELLAEHSLHAVGKRLQQSRRKLHRQRQQLRKALEDSSLQDYLPGPDNRVSESRM